MVYQIVDCNYRDTKTGPIISVYGITPQGKSIKEDIKDFYPYFFIQADYVSKRDFSVSVERIEEVERYLPIGYQKNKTTMFKVTLTHPRDVRLVRDEAKQCRGFKEIYEADIPFKNRYLIDHDLGGMCWTHDGESPVDRKGNAQLRYMALDLEVLPPETGGFPDPENDPIIICSLAFYPPDRTSGESKLLRMKNGDERQLIKDIDIAVRRYDPDCIVGHNLHGFDFNYLLTRANINRVSLDWGRDGSSIRYDNQRGLGRITGRVVLDTLPIVRKNYSLRNYKLETVSSLVNMKKGDVEAKDMRKMWESQDQRFFDYAKQDALIVLALIRDLKIIDKYIALSMLTGALLQDVVDGGQTVLIEALLFREFRKNDRVMPMRPQRSEEDEEETFTGATVIPPKIGLTEHVLTHDMTSLYPTTIISKNICVSTLLIDDLGCKKITSPDGVGFVDHSVYHGILPRILRRLFDARIEAKKLMKTKTGIEKEALDARQYGLKIMMNSFYGWLGYKRSRLYKREVAAAVTSFGRENLEYVKRFLEENYHVEVVGGDTDSIWSRVGDLGAQENYAKLGKEIADAVTKTLPEPMGLAYENYMKKLLIVAKKRYAGLIVNDDGNQTVKIKGLEVIRRDFCPMTSNMLEDLLDIILKDGDIEKAIKRVQQDVHRIEGVVDMSVQGHLTKEMMEPLTLTRRYRGGEGHKTMQPHDIVAINVKKRGDKEYVLGDRIPFAITIGRGSLMSDNHIGGNTMRERAEDIDYIIKNNYIIDGKWYVEHQLIPPALRLLSPFNIDKEVLFCRKSYVQTSRKKKLRGLTWDDILPILRPGAQKSTS